MLATVAGARIAALATLAAVAALAVAFAVGTPAEELKVIHLDFGSVAFLTVAVRPFAGAKFPFHVELGAFLDEFFNDVRVAAPRDDVVPFRVLTGFAVAVAIAFGRGEAEGGHLGVALGALGIGIEVTDIGVVSNVTDQHDFIECHSAKIFYAS